MRYRALSSSGDYVFGQGPQEILTNTPAAVGQLVLTTLRLFQGEFFLDLTAGTPWFQSVIGQHPSTTLDSAIKNTILKVSGVTGIVSYLSTFNPATRQLTVTCTVSTIFSVGGTNQTTVTTALTGFGAGGFNQLGFGG